MKRLFLAIFFALFLAPLLTAPTAFAACSVPTGNAGDLIYNRDARAPTYCNGGAWVQMGGQYRYAPHAVVFDGVTAYMTLNGALTGAASSQTGTGSFWFQRNGGLGVNQNLFTIHSAANIRFTIGITSNLLQIQGVNSANTKILQVTSSTAITDSKWHHYVFSFNLAGSCPGTGCQIYLDDTAETVAKTSFTNDFIEFAPATGPTASIGASQAGAALFDGALADFWLQPGVSYDLSVAANRRYFIDANKQPENLGLNGQNGPTGASPLLFMSGPTSSWQTNNGTGGGFTMHGTSVLTTAAYGPTATGIAISHLADLASGNGGEIVTHGNYAYQAAGNTFNVINISNPASPSLAGSISSSVFNGLPALNGIVVDNAGHYVYVCTDQGIVTVDVSNPASPQDVAHFNSPSPPVCVSATDTDNSALTMSANYLYASDNGNGHELTIVDASNPLALSLMGQLAVTGLNTENIVVSGNYAYAAAYSNNTFDVINISNPAAPTLAGTVADSGVATVALNPQNSNIVYAGDFGSNGVVNIIDVTNKAAPAIAGTISIGRADPTDSVFTQGNRLYVTDNSSNIPSLFIYDLTNATSPMLLAQSGSIACGCGTHDSTAVSGNYIYTNGNFSSWQVTDGGACASPTGNERDLMYNTGSNHVMQSCDGANWQPLGPVPGAGGGGCSSPAGAEGDMIYNADKTVMQYCDGTNWIAVGGAPAVGSTVGLVGWWKLDDGSGTSAADSSGNSNTGTLTNGPTWTANGADNGALTFNGTNQYVSIPYSSAINPSQTTVSAWAYVTGGSGTYRTVVSSRYNTDPTHYYGYTIYANTGDAWTFWCNIGGASEVEIGNAPVTLNTWTHVAIVADGTNGFLYINGTLIQQKACAYVPQSWSINTRIGDQTSSAFPFNGTIDDVRIYNRALSASEVSDLYHATGGQ